MRTPQENHDFQFRLPQNKKWIKQELVRISKDNGISLSQLLTLILSSWLAGRRGKKVLLGL